MTKITLDDLPDSYCIEDTRRPNEKVFWATLPAMKGLYDMAWVLADYLEHEQGAIGRERKTAMKEWVGLTRAALRKERAVARVPGNSFIEDTTVIVGFDINMSKLVLITEILRITMNTYGGNMLRRFEGYLCLLEGAMKTAAKADFDPEAAW